MGEKKVELLLSAMHQHNFDIGYRMGAKSDLLIINQCDREDYQELQVDGYLWRMISTTERGLAKSRNMALKNAMGDLCLLCDDDETLEEDYVNIVQNAYNALPHPAAVVFNLNRVNYTMKKTYYRIEKIKKATPLRAYGSPMLALDRHQIQEADIHFNEKFGSGTEWGGGEDSLFEYDILKNGLTIYEYPAVIATIDYSQGSSWFHGYTEQYFYNAGAFNWYRYKNPFVRLLRELYTCYKLRREKTLSPMEKMLWMWRGERGIQKNVPYSKFVEQRKSN